MRPDLQHSDVTAPAAQFPPLVNPDPALAVTNHAVTRYVQRILHKTIDGPFDSNRDEARAHCHAVGMTIRDVRKIIWTPGVAVASKMRLPSVDNGKFQALMDPLSGVVRTILPARQKSHGRLKLLTEREFAKKCQRDQRKAKRRPTAQGLKANIDEEGFENA